jgi:hypothetical protein
MNNGGTLVISQARSSLIKEKYIFIQNKMQGIVLVGGKWN